MIVRFFLFLLLAAGASAMAIAELPAALIAPVAITSIFALGGLRGLKVEIGLILLALATPFVLGYIALGVTVCAAFLIIILFVKLLKRLPSILVGGVVGVMVYFLVGLFFDEIIRKVTGGTALFAMALLSPTQMLWLFKRITDGLGLQIVGYTLHQDPKHGEYSTIKPKDDSEQQEEVAKQRVDKEVSRQYNQPTLRVEIISTREEFFALRAVANLAGLWFAKSGSKPFGLFKQIATVWIVSQNPEQPKQIENK